MIRLADKAAMRIMSISRAIRGGPAVAMPAPVATPVGIGAATELPAGMAPAAPSTGAELNAAPVDTGTILQGGDMFDAITKGAA